MERKTKSKSKKENKKKTEPGDHRKTKEMAVGLKDYFGLLVVSVFLKAVRAGIVFM